VQAISVLTCVSPPLACLVQSCLTRVGKRCFLYASSLNRELRAFHRGGNPLAFPGAGEAGRPGYVEGCISGVTIVRPPVPRYHATECGLPFFTVYVFQFVFSSRTSASKDMITTSSSEAVRTAEGFLSTMVVLSPNRYRLHMKLQRKQLI
jgi:hypothetical protein